MNLLKETEEDFRRIGKTWDDVSWVGSADVEIPVDAFKKAAWATEYDSGYGTQEIPADLIVVFKDGSFLERYEYDGSEYWVHKEIPQRPSSVRNVTGSLEIKDYKYKLIENIGGLDQQPDDERIRCEDCQAFIPNATSYDDKPHFCSRLGIDMSDGKGFCAWATRR
jgi:hypothetical protein